jgi:hypothetical protein
MMAAKKPPDMRYDPDTDTIDIEGVRIDAEIFRLMRNPDPEILIRAFAREGDRVVIQAYRVNLKAFETWYATQRN